LVHEVLKSQEPHAVSLDFTQIGNSLAAVKTLKEAALVCELANAVERSVIKAACAVGLGLKTDTDMLDRAGEEGVCDACEAAREVILAVAEGAVSVLFFVELLQSPARFVEGSELNANLGYL
jgi:hypothetical protein